VTDSRPSSIWSYQSPPSSPFDRKRIQVTDAPKNISKQDVEIPLTPPGLSPNRQLVPKTISASPSLRSVHTAWDSKLKASPSPFVVPHSFDYFSLPVKSNLVQKPQLGNSPSLSDSFTALSLNADESTLKPRVTKGSAPKEIDLIAIGTLFC
jgi:hypothetical protein